MLSPPRLRLLFHLRHTRLYHVVVPVHIVLSPTALLPATLPLPSVAALDPLLLDLRRRQPCRFIHAIAQERDFLLVNRPQLHLLPDDLLDAQHKLDVVLRNERDRLAGAPRTRCTPDAVDVVFGVCGDVVVDDDVNRGDIETSDVRCDDVGTGIVPNEMM